MKLSHCSSAAVLAMATMVLTGCGLTSVSAPKPATVSLAGVKGSAFGGQQPIVGAAIQLYAAGTAGTYGTGASALVSGQGVISGVGGNFALTGAYTCTTGQQIYVVAAGGNPGSGINNSSALIVGMGPCENLNSNTFISLNEVTTVGTIWALAPFMNGVNIGAPASNTAGLLAAFTDINTLINTSNGSAGGPAAPANATVPTSAINTLADVLAACVNSTGAGDGGACDSLFGYTTQSGVVPANTIAAAINMVRNPGTNVTNLINLSGPTSPFQPTMSSATDLTLAVSYTGGGLNAPSALAVDASGNIWAANAGNNSATEITHGGAVLSGSTGFTAGSLSAPSALAIDTTGNVWFANSGNSTLTELSTSGAGVGVFSGGGLSTPTSIAFDGSGNAWLANSGNNSISEFSATGTAISPGGTGYALATGAAPVSVAITPR